MTKIATNKILRCFSWDLRYNTWTLVQAIIDWRYQAESYNWTYGNKMRFPMLYGPFVCPHWFILSINTIPSIQTGILNSLGYSTVPLHFRHDTYHRHLIAPLWGWPMGFLLWVQSMIYVDHTMGLLPDTQYCGLHMRREYRQSFLCHRGLAIPTCIAARAWRTCRDACRDR